ncbi:hypothetical protein ACFCX4_27655 [Kitasatospora sp. NPDC056327]|uniref:hypothetical protein n=1 Tax=Kitasatospora sp. NPDC056327 TaxID=3345785 RepID=UPI0035DE83A5
MERNTGPAGPAPAPDTTTYRVRYVPAGADGTTGAGGGCSEAGGGRAAGARRPAVAEVTVVPGYSRESDIPAILAARLTGRPGEGRRIVVLAITEA